jgi:hypothetical protein
MIPVGPDSPLDAGSQNPPEGLPPKISVIGAISAFAAPSYLAK